MVDGGPIRGNLALRVGQAELAIANERTQTVLQLILGIWRSAGLRPEVARIVGGPAELERHQVVVLVVAQRLGVAVGGQAGLLLRLGDRFRWADGLGVAVAADRRLKVCLVYGGADGARGAPRVGQREQ